MICATCRQPIPADAVFCPSCGARATPPAPRPASAAGLKTLTGLETVIPTKPKHGTAAARGLTPGKLFAGRYTIERLVGEGGTGIVYLAKDAITGEEIVLKLLHADLVTPEAMQRLVKEGVTSRQIRHPSVVAVYDVGLLEGQPYLTMEFVPGITLRSWIINAIRSGRETGLDTALAIIRPILSGLAEAHRIGVVHRDLKPENIMLSGEPGADDFLLKILDFGIARAINTNAQATSNQRSGGAVGTALYMAPEQRTAPDTVGPPADLYSVSAILYELLMDAPPQNVWEAPSAQRKDIPKAIDGVIEQGLRTRARSRFQSADEYLRALNAVAAAKPAPEPPPQPDKPKPATVMPGLKSWTKGTWIDWSNLAPEGKKRRKRQLAYAVVGLLVLGSIGNYYENLQNLNTTRFTGSIGDYIRNLQKLNAIDSSASSPPAQLPTPSPAPVAPPPASSVNGSSLETASLWYDDAGNQFAIYHDGGKFSAGGTVRGSRISLIGEFTDSGNYLDKLFDGVPVAFNVFNVETGIPVGHASGRMDPSGETLSYALSPPGDTKIFFAGQLYTSRPSGRTPNGNAPMPVSFPGSN